MSLLELGAVEVYRFAPLVFSCVKPSDSCLVRPKPRSGHRVVCDDCDMYLFGGFCPRLPPAHANEMNSDPVWTESRPLYRELWRFNLSSRTWHKIRCEQSMPRELASSAAFLRNGVMFVFGGSGFPFGSARSNRVFAYDVRGGGATGMREVPADGARPRRMYGQAILLLGPHLYAVGGTTGFEFSSDVHRLDLRTGMWEEVYICTGARTEEPSGRYRHELAYDGERIFLLGGGTGDEACSLKRIHAFHVSERHWEHVQTLADERWGYPRKRRYHGCVQLGRSAYIVGGFDDSDILGDVWQLDLVNLRWMYLPSCTLPRPLYFHSTALTPTGCLYCFGGVKSLQGECTRTAKIYRAWLTIPSLEEMCCEAVRHYAQYSTHFSKQHLSLCGLPRKMLNRIFS